GIPCEAQLRTEGGLGELRLVGGALHEVVQERGPLYAVAAFFVEVATVILPAGAVVEGEVGEHSPAVTEVDRGAVVAVAPILEATASAQREEAAVRASGEIKKAVILGIRCAAAQRSAREIAGNA